MDGLLSGIAFGLLSGIILGAAAGISVLACKHPTSYEKIFGELLIILLGALAGGTFWDLSHGGYSRFIVVVAIAYFSFLRVLSLLWGKDKVVKDE